MELPVLTKHSEERLRERNGLNKGSVNRVVEKAYIYGIKHNETKGNLNKWITSLYFKQHTANNVRLYGDKAYLFNGEKLITVIQIPNNLIDIVNKIAKKKKEDLVGEDTKN